MLSAYTNTVVIGVFELGLVVGALLTLGAFAAPLFTKNGAVAEIVPLDVRQDVERRLRDTPALGTAATAARIYEAVKEVVDAAAEANKNLESKANGLVALSSALLGFGVSLANAHRVEHAWLAILGAVALVGAIIFAARVNFVRAYALPSPIAYNLPSVANLADNEAKILVELAEAWNAYGVDERNVGVEKAHWLTRGLWAMIVGVVLFVLMSADALLTNPSTAATAPTAQPLAGGISAPSSGEVPQRK